MRTIHSGKVKLKISKPEKKTLTRLAPPKTTILFSTNHFQDNIYDLLIATDKYKYSQTESLTPGPSDSGSD